jgi:glycerate-2-kinase
LIASGPTVASSGTRSDAWDLIQRRPLPPDLQFPPRVLEVLKEDRERAKMGTDGDQPSLLTSSLPPPASHPVFQASYTSLVGNNAVAVKAAADAAAEMGYHPVILTTQMSGEASQVAPLLVSFAHHLQATAQQSTPLTRASSPSPLPSADNPQFLMVATLPVALILGGETTVTLPPDCQGVGGRNQEMSLQGALSMRALGMRDAVMANIGTDGGDGPTDAAGAIVDGGMIERLDELAKASDALRRHDAYTYLSQQDTEGWSSLVKTGPTGTNVADVCIMLVHERGEHV